MNCWEHTTQRRLRGPCPNRKELDGANFECAAPPGAIGRTYESPSLPSRPKAHHCKPTNRGTWAVPERVHIENTRSRTRGIVAWKLVGGKIYECMHASMSMHECMRACMGEWNNVCNNVCVYVCLHVCVYVCMYDLYLTHHVCILWVCMYYCTIHYDHHNL